MFKESSEDRINTITMTKLINAARLQQVYLYTDQDLLAAGVMHVFKAFNKNTTILHTTIDCIADQLGSFNQVIDEDLIFVDLPDFDSGLWTVISKREFKGHVIVVLPSAIQSSKLKSDIKQVDHIMWLDRKHAIKGLKQLLYTSKKIDTLNPNLINQQVKNDMVGLNSNCQLTARELEVVQEIYNARTNREIAHLFHISIQTVNVHRKNIMKKLEVNNTVALVRKIQNLGIVAV